MSYPSLTMQIFSTFNHGNHTSLSHMIHLRCRSGAVILTRLLPTLLLLFNCVPCLVLSSITHHAFPQNHRHRRIGRHSLSRTRRARLFSEGERFAPRRNLQGSHFDFQRCTAILQTTLPSNKGGTCCRRAPSDNFLIHKYQDLVPTQ